MVPVHIIKLAVGVDSLHTLHQWECRNIVEYHGRKTVPCLTRYRPKRFEEILATGGSLYRVVNRYIVCRHKVLGFETVETQHKGTMCAIMQDVELVRTMPIPKRAFQGWRYLKETDRPEDIGIYTGSVNDNDAPPEIIGELHRIGLL